MDELLIWQRLLDLARAERYADIRALPEAGDWRRVTSLSSALHRSDLSGSPCRWFRELDLVDKASFTRAVAVLEDTAGGGLGSVTAVQRLRRHLGHLAEETMDWVLDNTNAWGYYAHGATSYAEYEINTKLRAEARKRSAARHTELMESEREESVRRKAAKATSNLSNAVQRGDIKAVRALLANGADPMTAAPDGKPLKDMVYTPPVSSPPSAPLPAKLLLVPSPAGAV